MARGGRSGRDRGEAPRTSNTAAGQPGASLHPAKQALQVAEEVQQRGERRRGAEALPFLQQAAERFKQALDLAAASPNSLSAEEAANAAFGLGESLQAWAEAVVRVASELPDAQLSPAAESQAREQAGALFQQSVHAYQQVREGPEGAVRVDALVNSGNALASCAELALEPGGLLLLERAGEAYAAAIAQEEDSLTWSNAADALVARAEHLREVPGGGAAQLQHQQQQQALELYGEAMTGYQRACSLSSSEQGDDLPELLHNWGVGLHSLGTHHPDPAVATATLSEAAEKLRHSIQFNRADVAPHNALGDVLVAQAERIAASGAGDAVASAAALLGMALSEGYGAALLIRATDADALVGTAEVHAQLSRLARQSPDPAVASTSQQHCSAAADAYRKALYKPQALGSFSERCNLRYNYACVCALSGRYEEAAQTLQGLLAVGGTSAEDLANDADFEGMRSQDWFQALLRGA